MGASFERFDRHVERLQDELQGLPGGEAVYRRLRREAVAQMWSDQAWLRQLEQAIEELSPASREPKITGA